ncbi:MAG: ABC transporter permease [Opitutaceae bacterium]|nr:ABC transporter permease [Opitutaceae bacterium]
MKCGRYRRELAVAVVLGCLLVGLRIFAPAFYQAQPLLSLATREAPSLIVTCGMVIVILARQIDISVGSLFSVCGVACGLLAARGWPVWSLLPAGALIGGTFGAVNGALVAGLGLPSIVVTLAMLVALRQGLNLFRQGEFVTLPDGVQWFGMSQMHGQIIVLCATALLVALLGYGLQCISLGRHFYAVGSDAEAARLAGLKPRRVTFLAFVLLGALTGIAAVVNVVQSPQVQPLTGNGMELKVIAAVVVGGVAISGGRGYLWGAVIGLLLLACISPALVHLHLEAYWEKAIQGAIILLAVLAEGLRARNSRGHCTGSP